MIVWGGNTSTGVVQTGGLYSPGFNNWTATPIDASTPSARDSHVSVLSGNGLIVWSGNGLDSGAELCLCSPTATWYQDLDGDGFGNAGAIVKACQQPAGYVPIAGDCNAGDGSLWSTPGEALGLMFDDPTHMHWSPPSAPGAVEISYDLLKSDVPYDFVNATACTATEDPMVSVSDEPLGAAAFFYRVRARNGCPAGVGPLGNDSQGAPVSGRACP